MSVSSRHSTTAFNSSSDMIFRSTSPNTSSSISKSHSPVTNTFLAKFIPFLMLITSSCFFSDGWLFSLEQPVTKQTVHIIIKTPNIDFFIFIFFFFIVNIWVYFPIWHIIKTYFSFFFIPCYITGMLLF